jgi:LysM repeat protein
MRLGGVQMSTVIYLVRPGDTLTSIAKRYHTTVESLVRANNIREPDRLRVGQLLRIQIGAGE